MTPTRTTVAVARDRVGAGRFAPSPTGQLHLGNLRTALLAWLSARHQGLDFIVRMEDLDRQTSSTLHETEQLRDLGAIGLDWDGEVVRQSDRFHLYDEAIEVLAEMGLTYECYCTRREVREAASAPHGSWPEGTYPGTCRQLDDAAKAGFRREGRRPALRLRGNAQMVSVHDDLMGPYEAIVDDVVLRRNDGVAAYNLAVVVDDTAQGITEVVRGNDLLSSTPRQVLLQRLLRYSTPVYRHIPMALNEHGQRLAKRDGAVTLEQLAARGVHPPAVLTSLACSLGLAEPTEPVTLQQILARFDIARLPTDAWVPSVNM